MRYIDSGARDPDQALGTWLQDELLSNRHVTGLRWQTGFFDAGCLGYFASAMARLSADNNPLHVLIGSNDGMTQRSDVETLMRMAGPPRENQQIGVVTFQNAYFHPKTIQIVRRDGSSAAYVGSANLTSNGIASHHVEAGLLLDTRCGDDPEVLEEIGDAIDCWFSEPRPGLNLVNDENDLNNLVTAGLLDVPPPPTPPRPKDAPLRRRQSPPLRNLLRLPPLPNLPPLSEILIRSVASWSKALTRSDAQRKGTGNQRGSITLVQAGHQINAQTFFRQELFGAARWRRELTRTREHRETASIVFDVEFLGRNLGQLELPVTYAPNREAAQANYTSLLHLGRLAHHFANTDVTGRWLEITAFSDGTFRLTIT